MCLCLHFAVTATTRHFWAAHWSRNCLRCGVVALCVYVYAPRGNNVMNARNNCTDQNNFSCATLCVDVHLCTNVLVFAQVTNTISRTLTQTFICVVALWNCVWHCVYAPRGNNVLNARKQNTCKPKIICAHVWYFYAQMCLYLLK